MHKYKVRFTEKERGYFLSKEDHLTEKFEWAEEFEDYCNVILVDDDDDISWKPLPPIKEHVEMNGWYDFLVLIELFEGLNNYKESVN